MSHPLISLVVALDKNYLIGNNNKIPWHIPGELKNFRDITMHKPIIMGRKTHQSIGKVLDGRVNIVISRQESLKIKGVEVYMNFREAIEAHQSIGEIMVIGGSEIYQLALPFASRLYITHIDKIYDGDTWFPKFDLKDWSVVKSSDKYESSTDTHYRNIIYDKINV